MSRGAISVEGLLKIILLLIVALLALDLLENLISIALGPFAYLRPIISLLVLALIVLWLLDRL